MQITHIEIAHDHYCRDRARHIANVSLTLKNRMVSLFCQIDLPEDESQAARRRAFVRDAVRQLLRMPEFRTGRETLEFPDHLAGTAPSQPA